MKFVDAALPIAQRIGRRIVAGTAISIVQTRFCRRKERSVCKCAAASGGCAQFVRVIGNTIIARLLKLSQRHDKSIGSTRFIGQIVAIKSVAGNVERLILANDA